MVRALSQDGPRAASIVLSKRGNELKEFAEQYGDTGQAWVCFAAEKATYDSKTGQVTPPTEMQIEEKIASLPLPPLRLPPPRYKAELDRFYETLQAVNSNELAKAAVDVGCSDN